MVKRRKKSKRSRTGPKNKSGGCKYGVNKITGNCLKSKRSK